MPWKRTANSIMITAEERETSSSTVKPQVAYVIHLLNIRSSPFSSRGDYQVGYLIRSHNTVKQATCHSTHIPDAAQHCQSINGRRKHIQWLGWVMVSDCLWGLHMACWGGVRGGRWQILIQCSLHIYNVEWSRQWCVHVLSYMKTRAV